MLDVLELPRNLDGFFTEEENAARWKRRFKYSSRERLFYFLHWLREYRTFRKQKATNVLASAKKVESGLRLGLPCAHEDPARASAHMGVPYGWVGGSGLEPWLPGM